MPKSHNELVKGWIYTGATYSFNVRLRLEWNGYAFGQLFLGLGDELCLVLAPFRNDEHAIRTDVNSTCSAYSPTVFCSSLCCFEWECCCE